MSPDSLLSRSTAVSVHPSARPPPWALVLLLTAALSACQPEKPEPPPPPATLCGNGTIEAGEGCDGNCPTQCNDNIACTRDVLTGSASTCNATCTHQPVTVCEAGDGCCAPGCNANTDSDCSPSCGNGTVESGEACDGSCPTSCDDGNACTTDVLAGSAQACSAVCGHSPITACTGGDGCCAPGCNSTNDSDCSPVCGNGTVESGEACDGNCPTWCNDGNACTTDTLTGSASSCDAACTTQPVTACIHWDGCCAPGCNANTDSDCSSVCGNSVIEPGEVCDGNCPTSCDDGDACTIDSLAGTGCNAACATQLITTCTGGDGCCASGCNANNDSDCTPACGNGVVELGETCDGNCPTSCGDGKACTTDVMTGSASTCDVTCGNEPITVCGNGDGCCAPGCNGANDNSCPSVCGNSIVEPGETCDGNCPTSCNDDNVCTTDALTGSASTCNAACTNKTVTACTGGDGCCPLGCRRADDSDCPEPLRVNGEVGTTTWSGEVIVTGTVTVTPGSTLTIAAGTHVSFDFVDADSDGKGDVALVIDGTLTTQGDKTHPVTMTASSGTQPGSWKGVLLRGTGSTLQGVTVQYAQTGVLVEAGTHTLPRLKVLSSSGPGVQVKAGAAAALSDCTLKDNGGAGASSADARLDITYCELSGNETGANYSGTATGLLSRSNVNDNRGEGLSLWRSATGGEPSTVISYNNFSNNSTQRAGRYVRGAIENYTSREWSCYCYQTRTWTAPAGATVHTLYVSYGESQYFNDGIYSDVWAQDVNILHLETDWSGYVDVSARGATKIGAGIRDLEAAYTGSAATIIVDLLYYGDASLGDTQVVAVLSKTGIDARNNYWNGAFYLPDLAALFAMPTNNPYASDAASRTVDWQDALWSRVSNAGPR